MSLLIAGQLDYIAFKCPFQLQQFFDFLFKKAAKHQFTQTQDTSVEDKSKFFNLKKKYIYFLQKPMFV